MTDRGKKIFVFAFLAIVSVSTKLLLSTQCDNWDIESYEIVADTTLAGDSVYAETTRYNYGPAWAHILAAIRRVQIGVFGHRNLSLFHEMIAGLLACVDVAIAMVLWSRFSYAAGLVFLLNPVSLLVTGFHTQFDNAAVLLGMLAIREMFRNPGNDGDKNFIIGAFLLGLSLVLKHVLVFLPMWLMFRPDLNWRRRLLAVIMPYAVFLVSFMPYAWDPGSLGGIYKNVFGYSDPNFPGFYPTLVGLFIPLSLFDMLFGWVPVFSGFKFVMLASIAAAGFLFRRRPWPDAFMLNLVTLCVFSSQLADQYLAIPLVACAFFTRSWLMWAYMVMAAVFLLGLPACVQFLPWAKPVTTLCGFVSLARWQTIIPLFIFLLVAATRVAVRHKCLREQG